MRTHTYVPNGGRHARQWWRVSEHCRRIMEAAQLVPVAQGFQQHPLGKVFGGVTVASGAQTDAHELRTLISCDTVHLTQFLVLIFNCMKSAESEAAHAKSMRVSFFSISSAFITPCGTINSTAGLEALPLVSMSLPTNIAARARSGAGDANFGGCGTHTMQ